MDVSECKCTKWEKVTVVHSNLATCPYVLNRMNILKLNSLPIRQFRFDNNIEVTVSQINQHFATGAIVWPSSILLSRFLSRLTLSNRSVFELGSGVGLPSIVASYRTAKVISSDKKKLQILIADNFKRNNFHPILIENTDYQSPGSTTPSFPCILDHHWGEELHRLDYLLPFDIVICSDVIYFSNIFPSFMISLKHVASKDTLVLMGHKVRDAFEERKEYFTILKQDFYIWNLNTNSCFLTEDDNDCDDFFKPLSFDSSITLEFLRCHANVLFGDDTSFSADTPCAETDQSHLEADAMDPNTQLFVLRTKII